MPVNILYATHSQLPNSLNYRVIDLCYFREYLGIQALSYAVVGIG